MSFYWNKIGKIGNYCQFKHQRCVKKNFTLPLRMKLLP